MIFIVSWRNVWRNKVRSLVIIIAIVVGVFAGAFMWAFYGGMVQQRITSAIKSEASHIQIHNKSYLSDPDSKYVIRNIEEKEQFIREIKGVSAVSSRIIMTSMLASANTGSGAKIVAVDPNTERDVTNISDKIIDGTYFKNVGRRIPVVIGEKLAEKLKVKIKSNVFIYLQQSDGTLIKVAFKVTGIYKTGNTAFEELNVFIRKSDLISVIHFNETGANEIAVYLKDDKNTLQTLQIIHNQYPDLDVKSWRELMPEVSLVEETMDISMIFVLAIILLGLLFGIINTMLMAVLDRIKELGMLMAIGMNRIKVFLMIMMETILLSLTGGVLGIFVAIVICELTKKTGLNLSAWGDAYQRMGYDTIIYPVIEMRFIIYIALMVFITGILGAIFPAFKALKLRPAEAVRIDV